MRKYQYVGCTTGFSENGQVMVWQPNVSLQTDSTSYTERLVGVGFLTVNIANEEQLFPMPEPLPPETIIEPIEEIANYHWALLTNPSARQSGDSITTINSSELGFNGGSWIGNIHDNLIDAFYIAMQFIQYKLAYRIHLPQNMVKHVVALKIGVEQRVLYEQGGNPIVGDVSYSSEAMTGIDNMSKLIEVGFGSLSIYNHDFSKRTLDINGVSYIDVYFDSPSSFKVATNQGFIGQFTHRFKTNIVGIQMTRLNYHSYGGEAIIGDVQHLNVEKISVPQILA